jgi:phosphoglycerol transferase MdoB-like AlkP superfamily enzyme
MKQRALYLIETYLLTVLIFIIAKLVFMLCNQEGHQFTVGDVSDVIIHGLSLDLSTSLYFLILPFLVTIVSIYWNKKNVLSNILSVYHLIIAIAFSLAFVADTSLYKFWQFKLDASCLQYLETPTEAMASVSWGYIVIRLVVFLLVAMLLFNTYQVLVRPLRTVSSLPTNFKYVAYGLLSFLALVPVFIIGIRGGLAESTTNIGQVYYSQNQFLNHSAVNPVFSFLSSFEKTASNIVDYDFYAEDECRQLMSGLYPTTSVDTDTLLTTTRPNIIVILMESAGEVVADYMPRLQQLKREGISFDNCYANSWRTDRGTVCTYSGYPSFPTSSVMKMPNKTRLLPGLAASLQKEGYTTHYLYGGDINFTNMRSYLIAGGFQTLKWMDDYSSEEKRSAKWGVRDGITFKTLLQMATATHSPYLIGYSTLSSHEPWDVPIKKYDDEVANAFYYLDQCIGQFTDSIKQTPQWKNTLIVLLPDHSIDFHDVHLDSILRNRMPMVWIGGAVKEPRRISTICNQTDLVAILLAQMHLPHDAFRWSRDVLSRSYRYPFAMHTYRNGFAVVDSTGLMVYDFDSNRMVTDKSTDSQRLERMGKAILQATTNDLKSIGTN